MNGSEDSALVGISFVENGSDKAIHEVAPLNPLGDISPVIDIADDGTWETKPFEAKSEAVGGDDTITAENGSHLDFLATRDQGNLETVKLKHVAQAHSSQYYVNCVQPVVQESFLNGGVLEVKTTLKENFTCGDEVLSTLIESSAPHVSFENYSEGQMEDSSKFYVIKTDSLNRECCAVPGEENVLKTSGSVEEKGLSEDTSQDLTEGVVVTDSILQNKEKTKTYWEEIMMAAVATSPPGKDQKVHIPEAREDLSAAYPKVVETMAKRMNKEERIMEQERTVQKDWEEAVQTKQEGCVETCMTELKIAIELREMREREEELRKLRQELGLAEDGGRDDSALLSIPTTDEGNFSEVGGEEKDSPSQMMSLDDELEGSLQNGSCVRGCTQSLDSTSSGHSSTSGGQHVGVEYPPQCNIIAKPLAYADEDQISRSVKETPIEREIRTACEREEEFRREKGRIQSSTPTPAGRPEVSVHNTSTAIIPSVNSPVNVQLRLATDRIQREIKETTEREKELREAGKIQTMSEDTVDSKVTRIGEIADHNGMVSNPGTKIRKSLLAFQKNTPSPSSFGPELDETNLSIETPSAKVVTPHSVPSYTLNHNNSANTGLGIVGSNNNNNTGTPKRFVPIAGQRGLMERFLASRGKLTCISPFNSSSSLLSTTSTAAAPLSSNQNSFVRKGVDSTHAVNPATKNSLNSISAVQKKVDISVTDSQQASDESETETPHRRGWISTEEKIQEELKEMKIREDELRLQRAHIMAQSQPNLLSIMDEEDNASQSNEDLGQLPSLYCTLSNPNLLDLDGDSPIRELDSTEKQIAKKNSRRKSALIVHWENRIQQSN